MGFKRGWLKLTLNWTHGISKPINLPLDTLRYANIEVESQLAETLDVFACRFGARDGRSPILPLELHDGCRTELVLWVVARDCDGCDLTVKLMKSIGRYDGCPNGCLITAHDSFHLKKFTDFRWYIEGAGCRPSRALVHWNLTVGFHVSVIFDCFVFKVLRRLGSNCNLQLCRFYQWTLTNEALACVVCPYVYIMSSSRILNINWTQRYNWDSWIAIIDSCPTITIL